jgi:protoporphyrinogen oxidase
MNDAMLSLSKIGIIDVAEVLHSTVLRMEKTYPAYFGTYPRFAEIREHMDSYTNLFPIGRNGMHRYNN